MARHPFAGQVDLVLTDDGHLRRLNAAYRGKDRVTDVLSFDLGAPAGLPGHAPCGEIYISLSCAQRQAARQRVPLLVELARLLIHGLLHLAGYDHQTPAQRRFMDRETKNFLQAAGLPVVATPARTALAGRFARKELNPFWNLR
jgi:probable rRNA maturation factor